MLLGVSSTSLTRSALTDARGMSAAIHVAIITDIRICMMYCRKAISEPTCISPLSTRSAPNHTTATLDRFTINSAVGIIRPINRPPRSATRVSRSLPSSNRAISYGSRTKARTTRMPVICSRRMRLMSSMRSCMTRNVGTIRKMTLPMQNSSTGMATARIHVSLRSACRAMIVPPTMVMGAAINMVQVICTRIWIWLTSLVTRVIRLGAPKWATSRAEKSVTWWKRPARTSRPKPIAAFDPK